MATKVTLGRGATPEDRGCRPAVPAVLGAAETAARLPYPRLVQEIAAMLQDPSVQVPARLVQPLAHGASLFVMPAHDARIAIAKLITFTPANAGGGRPTIQGDVVVFDVTSGERTLLLHGPTVTARRTAAVSVLAAQTLALNTTGPLLIVGAGIQGHAHLQAFAACLPIREVVVNSRSPASADALVREAKVLGLRARVVPHADDALADCPLAVTCTPAGGVVLQTCMRADGFIAAVGSFTPLMVELGAALCQDVAVRGQIVLDTADARHEAGDLLQAGLDMRRIPILADALAERPRTADGPVLFKSCGWAGWDLAAARVACAAG